MIKKCLSNDRDERPSASILQIELDELCTKEETRQTRKSGDESFKLFFNIIEEYMYSDLV